MHKHRSVLPKVSIITPAYNQADYLVETIESVLGQTYQNIEYIVINDGSTDDTARVVNRYDGRIHYIYQSNIGQAATINKGWSIAKGQYIGYLSADDRLKPMAVESLVNILLEKPSIDVVYPDFDLIDANGSFISTCATEEYNYENLIGDLLCYPGPGALLRRKVFERYGGWDVSLKQVPDFDYWLKIARKDNFARLPKVMADYRVHQGSASFQVISYDRSIEILRVVKRYWSERSIASFVYLKNKSLSKAYLLVTKNHFQSSRYLNAIESLIMSLKAHPKSFLSIVAWRIVLSGVFRRFYYYLLKLAK